MDYVWEGKWLKNMIFFEQGYRKINYICTAICVHISCLLLAGMVKYWLASD